MSACARYAPASRRSIRPGNARASGARNLSGAKWTGAPGARLVTSMAKTGGGFMDSAPASHGSPEPDLARKSSTRPVTGCDRTLVGKETTKRSGALVDWVLVG